jgi:hypothetical protein
MWYRSMHEGELPKSLEEWEHEFMEDFDNVFWESGTVMSKPVAEQPGSVVDVGGAIETTVSQPVVIAPMPIVQTSMGKTDAIKSESASVHQKPVIHFRK